MINKKYTALASVATLLVGITLSSPGIAADSKAQIEHRKAIMEGTAGHLSAIFSTLKDPGKFAENFQFHAESLAVLAEIAVDTFPEGSGEGKTKASPDIWKKPDEFQQAMDKFLDKTEALVAAAKTEDISTLAAAAKEVGGSCKGCHDDFKDE